MSKPRGPRPAFWASMNTLGARGSATTRLCVSLVQRHVLDVCAGRKQTDVTGLLERLSDCDAVEAVSMDRSETFRGAVQLCLPQACIVADHFHVIQHVDKAVGKVF